MLFLKSFVEKISWDKEIQPEITNIWLKWEKVLPSYLEIPRLIIAIQEKIREIELLLFGNASIIGTSAIAYTVIQQTSSTTQGVISSKSRLSKKNIIHTQVRSYCWRDGWKPCWKQNKLIATFQSYSSTWMTR